MTLNITIEGFLETAHVGIIVSRREKIKYGLRLTPYCEIHSTDEDYIKACKVQLLKRSINSTVRPGFLRIQGIQNCDLVEPYIAVKWWKECMRLFRDKKHLTKEGIVRIIQLREGRERSFKSGFKVNLDEALETVLSYEPPPV